MAIATINPTTGETVETFEAHDAAEIARRIAEAADAAVTLRDTTTPSAPSGCTPPRTSSRRTSSRPPG